MTTQTLTELNAAQASIYTRTNLRRAFVEFDETDVAGIYVRDDSCVVVYRDGAERIFPKQKVKDAFLQYTHRLKDFFSYLGPNYRGPSIWHNNAYVMFKGWNYSHALGHLNSLDSPTFDFNFGVPDYVFWSTSNYPTNNLYLYHEKFIKEFVGKSPCAIVANF